MISLFLLGTVHAQVAKVKNDPNHDKRPIHFGFSLGLNMMDFNIKPSQFAQDTSIYIGLQKIHPGINIHAIMNVRVLSYLDVRLLPGISFGERAIYFRNSDGEYLYDNKPYLMESSYLEMPVLFKYKAARLNNFSAFIITGGNFKYDLAVKKEYDYNEQLFMVSPYDVYFDIGGGFDFYMEFFKLSFEIKYEIGLMNIFQRTNPQGKTFDDYPVYTDLINEIRSQIVVVSFHFE